MNRPQSFYDNDAVIEASSPNGTGRVTMFQPYVLANNRQSRTDLARRFPVRNLAWHYDDETQTYSAEASSLSLCNSDPWGRQLSGDVRDHRDREGELTHQTLSTSVCGITFNLSIEND